MKPLIPFLVLMVLGFTSCDVTCWNCRHNDTGEVGAVLCNDDPMYSSAYRDNWRYTCTANNGYIEEFKK